MIKLVVEPRMRGLVIFSSHGGRALPRRTGAVTACRKSSTTTGGNTSQPAKRTGAGGPGGARRPRQLRRPQAPQGPRLARPPPALHLPLHPHFRFLAQRGRGLLRQALQATPPARGVPFPGRALGRHQPLSGRAQYAAEALRLDRRSDRIIAAVKWGHQALVSQGEVSQSRMAVSESCWRSLDFSKNHSNQDVKSFQMFGKKSPITKMHLNTSPCQALQVGAVQLAEHEGLLV